MAEISGRVLPRFDEAYIVAALKDKPVIVVNGPRQ